MKLPEITLPDNLPAWLIEDFAGTDETAYATVEMSTGHNRKRRIFRRPPVKRTVSMMLTEAETQQFEAWFENDVLAGGELFSARMRDMGPGHIWYPAQFAEPYQADYQHWAQGAGKAHWKITAELILYGEGEDQGPELTSFAAAVRVPLTGSATGMRSSTFAASVRVPLTGTSANVTFAASVRVPLVGSVSAEGMIALSAGVTIPLTARAAPLRTTLFSAAIRVPLT